MRGHPGRRPAPATRGGRPGWAARSRARGVLLAALLLALVPLAAAGDEGAEELRVAASFTILAYAAERVGGDRVAVTSLTPVGAEVHEWELQPRGFRAIEDADLILYNGYNLEQWMRQVRAAAPDDAPLVPVAEASGFPTRAIVTGDFEGDPDPHLWMDPRAMSAYVEAIREALAERDPGGAEHYAERASAFQDELAVLHGELVERLQAVPEQRRVLITSEAAFPYFAAAYGLEHDGIWGTNAEEEGSPRQIMRIVDRIRERDVPAVFWESTISERYVRSVADETGVAVAGPLYVDSLSGPDGPAATYAGMMRHNARIILDALGEPGE